MFDAQILYLDGWITIVTYVPCDFRETFSNLVICASACERNLPHAPHELAKYKAGPENDWQAGLDERPGL